MLTLGRLGEHEISAGNHDAKRSGFQPIEFYKITNERGTKTMFTYAHVNGFMANQSARTI